jgi:hypothetical protein
MEEHNLLCNYGKGIKSFLRDIKVISGVNFDSDHRLLVADFKNIRIIMTVARTTSKFEMFKLQNRKIREEFQNEIKGKISAN